jgi:hypothetical protein
MNKFSYWSIYSKTMINSVRQKKFYSRETKKMSMFSVLSPNFQLEVGLA